MQILLSLLSSVFLWIVCLSGMAVASPLMKAEGEARISNALTPHKALYEIELVATRSGSQIVNLSGQMLYEWKPACEAWITDHRFNLFYEYTDAPAMRVTSDFSTYEAFDGSDFSFSARRKRNKELYQEFRGKAVIADKGGAAEFSIPENVRFDLSEHSFFPMAHTLALVRQAQKGENFFHAVVFDGSDDEGPVEINAFIGAPVNALQIVKPSEALDMALLNTKAWKVRMAVFPTQSEAQESDYEMSLVFHENGVISDMHIDYEDFSVSQKLIALEKVAQSEHNSACP